MCVSAVRWWVPRRALAVGVSGLVAVLLSCSLVVLRSGLGVRSGAVVVARGPVRSVTGSQGWSAVPATARLSISRVVGAEDPRFGVVRTGGGGLLARSAGGLSSRFSSAGALVSTGSTGVLRLRLSALGRGGSLRGVGRVEPTWRGDRVSYALAGVREWFANGPLGLEQGFTLVRRPAGAGVLTLAVGVLPRGVSARPLGAGRSLALSDRAGRVLARYDGLKVSDGSGRSVAARFALVGRRVLLRIDDRGARYPLRVDPFVQVAELTAPGGTGSASVAATPNGHVVAVGSGSGGGTLARVFVFTEPSGGWKNAHPTATLRPAAPDSQLGASVAISADGDTIVAGAPTQGVQSQGAVYVYTKPAKGWQHSSGNPTAQLLASDSTGYDYLGTSVAINAAGNAIVAGAPDWNGVGALYSFTEPSGGWQSTSEGRSANVNEPGDCPPSPAGCLGGEFGATVAMSASGDTIVTAAPFQNNDEGAVYVLQRSPFEFNYLGILTTLPDTASGTSDPNCPPIDGQSDNPRLGASVAISSAGKTIVAGEPCAGTGGQAVVYNEPAGGWRQASGQITAGLTPLRRQDRLGVLGSWVAMSGDGDTILAADPAYHGNGGFVATFTKPSRGWSHVNPPVAANFGSITSPTPLGGSYLGAPPIAITSDGGTVFVAATGSSGTGVVYVFAQRSPGNTPTKVSCSPSTVDLGKKSTCTATVKDAHGGRRTPTGTVSFGSNGGSAGHFSSSQCTLGPVPGHAGSARCSVKFTPHKPLAYTITARYSGDNHHNSGTATTVVHIPRNVTSTAISCSPIDVTLGVVAKCTATVTGVGGHPPSVHFKTSGGKLSGETCASTGTTETCSISFSSTAAGTYTISAEYPGDTTDGSSDASTKVLVTTPLPATSTSVSCSPSTIATAQTSSCTAMVTQITGPQAPPGVSFSSSGTGGTFTSEGCSTSDGGAAESCTVTFSSTSTGGFTVTASFPGDSDAAPSQGTTPVSVVNPTTTSVSCARQTNHYLCTASVTDTSASPSVPSGTVTWTVSPSGTFSAGGQCSLARAGSSDSTAACSIDFTPSNPGFTITAGYQGDSGHHPSSG